MVKKSEEISVIDLLKEAKKLINSNLFGKGIDILKKEVKRNPRHIEAWNLMGMTYIFMKEFKKAIECWRTSLEIDPNDLNLWFLIGNAYSALRKYKTAINWYKDILDFNPNKQWVNLQIGNNYLNQYKHGRQGIALLQEQKKLYKAIDYYEEELRIQPKSTNAWSQLGFTYFLLNSDEALSSFEKVVEINPKSVYGLFNLAFAYAVFQKYEFAIIYFKKLIEINPLKETIKLSKQTNFANPFENFIWSRSGFYIFDIWDLILVCYKEMKDKKLFREFELDYGLHYVEKFKSEIFDTISNSPIKPKSLFKLIKGNYNGKWTRNKKNYYEIAIEELIKDRAIEKRENQYFKIQ